MKIIHEPKLVIHFDFTPDEREKMEETKRIFNFLLDTFHSPADLVSLSTGEVIQVNEIYRVLGILDGLLDNPYWEFDQKVY